MSPSSTTAAAVQRRAGTFDPAKAVEILEGELKAKKGSDGIYQLPDGTKLGGWKLITPTGWTDWNTACEIVAKSVKEVGIGISTEFPQAPTMMARLQNGDFDTAMYSYTGVNPASPWIRFRDALDDRGSTGLRQDRILELQPVQEPRCPGPAGRRGRGEVRCRGQDGLPALDKIYRENVPVVPLMYRPLEFYEFNASNWENFPTEENPYAPPMWQSAGIQWLFKIKKIGT